MSKPIKIPRQNDITLKLPMNIKDASGVITPIDIAVLTNIVVTVKRGSVDISGYGISSVNNSILLSFQETLEKGTYSIIINAKYGDRDISTRLFECFQIVDWNKEATYLDYIAGPEQTLEESCFVYAASSEDLEQLRQQYIEKTHEAEQAKEEYERAKEELEDVAKETKATENKEEILRKIENTQPDLSAVAKEATLNEQSQAIKNKIDAIPQPDLSSVAKEAQATANKQAIIDAMNDECSEEDVYAMWGINVKTIYYTASAKLSETTVQAQFGLHTNAFNVPITSHTFENGNGTIIFAGKLTTIGNLAFAGCFDLTSITIPSSVVEIGENALWYCTGLTSVTIPNSVITIGDTAFINCDGLTSVTIPNSVTTIGEAAFSDCDNLVSVVIGNSVITIGQQVFFNCPLTSITLPPSIREIGRAVFALVTLRTITCKALIPPIIDGAGGYPPSLTAVYVPAASVDAYKAAENWSDYANIIQPITE